MFPPVVLASSSSSSSHNWSYDVFLSFRGEDVRQKFLSHFHKELERNSIIAFKDNEMESSGLITPTLVHAIQESRIAVVVFSKKYASSSWCLNELVEILKCKEEHGQLVIPIFYDLDPSHLRKPSGDFKETFENTCKNQTKKVENQWKQALTGAADIVGYHFNHWDSEAKMAENISRDILVRMVGIWGTSGIGKTIIARALYSNISSQFQSSVYLDRAFFSKCGEGYGRPNFNDYNMKLHLQEDFLSEILSQKDMKIGPMEERLKHQKVLIFIDELDDPHVLNALAGPTIRFGSGSRIIVVTTDRQLLEAHGIDFRYEVDLPSPGNALEIFCKAAFKQNSPPDGLMEFASEVVERAGRLPLDLNMLGLSLRGLNKEDCLKKLPSFRRTLDGGIEKTLKFSYNALGDDDDDDDDENLFDNIACLVENSNFLGGTAVFFCAFCNFDYLTLKDIELN
ncbi:hypothetical protein Bca4012_059766 [Brassica carinata]